MVFQMVFQMFLNMMLVFLSPIPLFIFLFIRDGELLILSVFISFRIFLEIHDTNTFHFIIYKQYWYGTYFSHNCTHIHTLQIMLDLLCWQLFMCCNLNTSSLGIGALLMMHFLSFCGSESHIILSGSHPSAFLCWEPLYLFSRMPASGIQSTSCRGSNLLNETGWLSNDPSHHGLIMISLLVLIVPNKN